MKSLSISLSPDGAGFALGLANGCSVTVPVTERGARFIEQLLHEQEAAGRATVGTAAAPTQAMITEWLKTNKVKKDTITLDDLLEHLQF